MNTTVEALASHRKYIDHVRANWTEFQTRRIERLRHGVAEKVAENIIEDLFTIALDWHIGDVDYQVEHADILLTRLGIKYILIEMKRPGSLAWNAKAVHKALEQARRYAEEQRVHCIAVSDGLMFYAADIEHGGLKDRVFVRLDHPEPQEMLWWVSVQGIYRPRRSAEDAVLRLLPETTDPEVAEAAGDAGLLHPKYHLPASCFAYVGDARHPSTWKLPFRLADGSVDAKRLPKAVQCILTNYRGAKVESIPVEAIPDVLERLATAVGAIGKLPHQSPEPAQVYVQLVAALEQFKRKVQ